MTSALGHLQWGADSLLELAAATLLAAVFVGSAYAAWRRLGAEARARFFGVLVLNATACLAIFSLLVPPVVPRPASDSIALITEGATAVPDDVASAYVAPGGGDYGRGPGYLLDVGQLLQKEPALGALTVTGHGLEAEDWRRLPEDVAVCYEPPPISGLVDVKWQESLAEGEPLIVTGRYLPDEASAARTVELVDPAGVAVATHDLLLNDAFELTALPKAPGLIDYRLRVLDDESVLRSEPVPAFVHSGRLPLIFIMQSAPSFETRQLKNWAGDDAATVIVHTVVTRDRELGQRVNAGTLGDDSLSPALLEKTDLAVVDGRTWVGLDPAQRGMFEAAVNDGLGLLILADDDLAEYLRGSTGLLEDFGLIEREREMGGYVPVVTGSTSEQPLPLLGFELEHGGGGVLTRVDTGDIVEAYETIGLGRVAVSILRERHRWFTSGDKATYTAYWAGLLDRVGRPRPLPYLLPLESGPMPAPDRRLSVCALAGSNDVSVAVGPLAGDEPLKLETGAPTTGGPRRCAVFWPWLPGWHRARLFTPGNDAALSETFFYVFAYDEWQSHRRYARQQATRRRAVAPGTDALPPTRTVPEAISPLWPWLVLMLSASLLWLERRLS